MASCTPLMDASLPEALRDQEEAARRSGALQPFEEAQALFDECGPGHWKPAIRGARVLRKARALKSQWMLKSLLMLMVYNGMLCLFLSIGIGTTIAIATEVAIGGRNNNDGAVK